MIGRCSWAEAQAAAKRSPQRGFMPPASALEILLPDLGGCFADIQRFACVPFDLRYRYHQARTDAFVFDRNDERRERAEDLLDEVLTVEAEARGAVPA